MEQGGSAFGMVPGQSYAPYATYPPPVVPPPVVPPQASAPPSRAAAVSRAPEPPPTNRRYVAGIAVVAVIALVATVVGGLAYRRTNRLADQLNASNASVATLRHQLSAANARIDRLGGQVSTATKNATASIPSAVAHRVLASVVMIETDVDLGSAFALQRTADGGTLLVTNYHVVSSTWESGARSVLVQQGGTSFPGRIDTVRPSDDLASITVERALPVLAVAPGQSQPGQPVLAVGSPLGLGGTVTSGVVSAIRFGKIQFSAPISPGNSGGPVVDSQGRVLGVAEEKIVGFDATDLGFAIPIHQVCSALSTC